MKEKDTRYVTALLYYVLENQVGTFREIGGERACLTKITYGAAYKSSPPEIRNLNKSN